MQESRADPRDADPSPGSSLYCPAHAPRTTSGEQGLGQAGKVKVLVLRAGDKGRVGMAALATAPGSRISE